MLSFEWLQINLWQFLVSLFKGFYVLHIIKPTYFFILFPDQVKRLYDTFHEPFKRVVSSHPPIPETPSQKDVERSSVNEVTDVEKDTEDINKRRKKEPELTVKSALSAAFAKYADKIG